MNSLEDRQDATRTGTARPRPTRVCVIGIDAADPGLIERWCDEGVLPTLAQLRRQGVWTTLAHAGEFTSGSVWPSLYTGTHPGRHGLFHSRHLVPRTWTLSWLVPEECAAPPLWAELDRRGLLAVIVDVPFAPSVEGSRGLQVFDWGTYERFRDPHSRPADVLPDLVRRLGPYPIAWDLSRNPPISRRDLRRAHAGLLRGAATKGAALRWLATHEPWDFFMGVFGETHAAGHYFWDLEKSVSETDGSGGNRGTGVGWSTPIRDVYRAVDAELGKFLEVLDPTTTMLMVLSGQGMGRNVNGRFLLQPVLRKLGLLVPVLGASRGSWGLGRLRASCPLRIRRAVSRHLPRSVQTAMSNYWLTGSIDRTRTRAFVLPSDQVGFVRINVAGREPDGIVEPSLEYDEVCGGIAEALERLVHARTGQRVVKDIFRADRAFPGPQRYRLPDLLVSWTNEAPIEAVRSEELGTITAEGSDPRSGNHRPQGFAILYGAGVERNRTGSGHILDVAPTILECLGLPPASFMEGRSWITAPRLQQPLHGDVANLPSAAPRARQEKA
jgi:predicted AlkP superfamily phosphohydrolase/phosphomutase